MIGPIRSVRCVGGPADGVELDVPDGMDEVFFPHVAEERVRGPREPIPRAWWNDEAPQVLRVAYRRTERLDADSRVVFELSHVEDPRPALPTCGCGHDDEAHEVERGPCVLCGCGAFALGLLPGPAAGARGA